MNKKKKYTRRVLRYFVFGIVVSLAAACVMEYFFNQFDFQETYAFVFQTHTKLFLYGAGILFAFYMGLTALTGSSILGSALLMSFSMLISVTSYMKFKYRNEPLYPNELGMITNFREIVTMVSILDIVVAGGVILAAVLITLILYRRYSLKKTQIASKPVHYGWRVLTLIFSIFFLVYTFQFNSPGNHIKKQFNTYTKWVTFNQQTNYERNGFIAGFLFNLSGVYMEEPAEYSEAKIKSLYEKYAVAAEAINTDRTHKTLNANVIYVMNESFTDPTKINGFSIDKDPVPFTRNLMKNTLSGESLALSIGGGTANSEFEALTSLSNEPFRVYAPFVEAADIMHKVPSMARKANRDELMTTAIHPYDPTLYKRLSVYEDLGFQDFLYASNMKYTEKLGNNRYISDRAAYQESLSVIEQTEKKDFVHLVTMQNHGGYRDKYEDPAFHTSVEELKAEGDSYLHGLNNSDLALKEFIAEVDRQEEEFLIVFWGDHLPGFYNDEIFSQNSDLNMRETPLFFYSNKRDLSGDIGTISPIFYTNYVLDILDIKVSPHEALLYNLEKALPGLSGGIYLEDSSEESLSARGELSDAALSGLMDFDLIQFDILTGEGYAEELGFFEQISDETEK